MQHPGVRRHPTHDISAPERRVAVHVAVPPILRSLSRTRGDAAAVIATLALGIAALSATLPLVDAVAFRQPPLPDAGRLLVVYSTTQPPGEPVRRARWAYFRFRALAERVAPAADAASYSPTTLNLTGTADAEPVDGEVVSASYFRVAGVTPALGRGLRPEEDSAPGANPAVVLGDAVWRRRFAADPGIVGHTIGLNGRPLVVVGVMPPGFRGLSDRAQLWFATSMAPLLTYADYRVSDQNFVSVVARVGAGVPVARAQQVIAAAGAAVVRAFPYPPSPDSAAVAGALAIPVAEARVDPVARHSVLLLAAAVALLHLLACANATSLLLGRAVGRRRDTAVRVAIGCSRRRLVRQVGAECGVLATVAGVVGGTAAWLALPHLQLPAAFRSGANFYGSLGTFDAPVRDWRFLVVLAGATVVTALVVAWAPALAALRVDLITGLKDGARGSRGGSLSLRRPSARGLIVAGEAALAVVLVVASGLMLDSFVRIRRTPIGVDPSHLLTFMLRPSEVRVPVPQAPAFLDAVLRAIARVPGVEGATVDGCVPVATGCANTTLQVVGRETPPDRSPPVLRHYVAPDHFRVLGVPVLRGRPFTSADRAGSPHVVIINETAARRFWPGEDALGARVWFDGGSTFDRPDSSAEVVGIVGDVAYQPIDQHPIQPDFFTPYAQFTYAWRMVMVRTTGSPAGAVPAVRAALRTVDPDLPLHDVQTMEERLGGSWARHRFDTGFLSAFAALALLLAAGGVYAVVARAVGERQQEMGIRQALGATPAAIARLVVRDGVMLPVVGVAVGVVGALGVTQLLRASLYEVSPTDPVVFASTALVMVAVAAGACLAPAIRAMRIAPARSMRE
jgi:putative ABC transport system permease protein